MPTTTTSEILTPPAGFDVNNDGVYAFINPKKGSPVWERISDWICVRAITRDIYGQNHGRLCEFLTIDAQKREIIIEAKKFATGGTAIIAELLSLGFTIEQTPGAAKQLISLLSQWIPEKRITTTEKLGWLKQDAFVLPSTKVIGSPLVKFTGDKDLHDKSSCGTLEGWRENVASLAVGNAPMIVAISAGFSGPLMEPLGLESGGIHFWGGSSCGKSTLLRTAASIWSSPNEIASWRSTDTAFETQAKNANGMVLCIDEMGQASAQVVGETIYMLGNNRGKARGRANGKSTPITSWHLPVLSTGEICVATKLAEGNKKVQAGQHVRLLGIRVDEYEHGAFDALHDKQSGRMLSEYLTAGTKTHYGVAGPEFLRNFFLNVPARLELADTLIQRFHQVAEADHPGSGRGVEGRARTRFAAIAAAGEFATRFGLTGWSTYTATSACLELFGKWLSEQQDEDSPEALHRCIRDFLMNNPEQIQSLDAGGQFVEQPLAWEKNGYLFLTREIWDQIFDRHDPQLVARILRAYGSLEPGDGRNILSKLPTGAGANRGYKVSLSGLQE